MLGSVFVYTGSYSLYCVLLLFLLALLGIYAPLCLRECQFFDMTPYFFISLQQHFELANYFSLFFLVFSNAVGCSSYMQDWPTYGYY